MAQILGIGFISTIIYCHLSEADMFLEEILQLLTTLVNRKIVPRLSLEMERGNSAKSN